MRKEKESVALKQQRVQQLYKEKLKKKKEKRDTIIFAGLIILGFLALAIYEQIFL